MIGVVTIGLILGNFGSRIGINLVLLGLAVGITATVVLLERLALWLLARHW